MLIQLTHKGWEGEREHRVLVNLHQIIYIEPLTGGSYIHLHGRDENRGVPVTQTLDEIYSLLYEAGLETT